MTAWWSVDFVVLELGGQAVSAIEAAGSVLYLASVALVARRNVLTWPVGIVSVLLYASLFWQLRLYADALEQAVYVALSAAGWIAWARRQPPAGAHVEVRWSSSASASAVLLATLTAAGLAGEALSHVHEWWPRWVPEPASLPRVDAATTVASLVAMVLIALRRTEAWLYWIVIDAVGIAVYASKGVLFVAGLYVALLVLAIAGLRDWTRPRAPE